MTITAKADLDKLGAAEGLPVKYVWTPTSLFPMLLSWVVTLLLLSLKANRTGKAWWIWAPLLVVVGVGSVLELLTSFLPADVSSLIVELAMSLAFGFAALWLLAFRFAGRGFLARAGGMWVVIMLFSLLSILTRADWHDNSDMATYQIIATLLMASATTLAISLASRCGRRCSLNVGLLLLTPLWLFVGWAVGLAVWMTLEGNMGLELFGIVLMGSVISAGFCYAVLLPFLVLAFCSPFYGPRVRAMLGREAAPPAQPSAPPPIPTVAEV